MKYPTISVHLRMLLIAMMLFTGLAVQPQPMLQAATEASCSAPAVHSATGNNAAAIQGDVDTFRTAIGGLNAPQPVNHTSGRREINWDAVPDSVAAPNDFPGDFFNANVAPRARGIEFSATGNEIYVSATAASGEGIEFDNFDSSYSSLFTVFSAERLFAPETTNVVDVHFFSPADQSTPALVDSFGVIFTDVDTENTTKMLFYDQQDNLIYTLNAPAIPGNETLSLAGVKFSAPCVYRVQIITGNIGLQSGVTEGNSYNYDLVAMDDFIYGEPQPITSCGTPEVYEAIGSNPGELQSGVDAYRTALGTLNAPAPFNNLDGRREINWDAAPDTVSAPNAFPGNFFNADFAPRARGAAFSTEGSGLQLSAKAASGTGVEFSNINPTYAATFQTFSAERLFTALGSNVVRTDFFNPAQPTTKARVDGFGAVFSDVDLTAQTSIAYYDAAGKLLFKQAVQANAGDGNLSFAGLKFPTSCVSFVKVTNGTTPLGSAVDDNPTGNVDLVVMDDFIYGEPVANTVCGAPTIYSAAGNSSAAINDQLTAYRNALGTLNPNEPTNVASGRREINWDAAPDTVSAPNAFPGNFFNFNAAPRARGIEFSTIGNSLQLSAKASTAVGIAFANIDASYDETFSAFSPERLFTAIGSNEVDARFFDPATQTGSALSNGFGAIFSDVDLANVTAIRYYDADNKLVYAQSVPAVTNSGGNNQQTFSFAGLKFDTACVARVRLISGNSVIEAGVADDPANGKDLVVMDDFIFGEPQPATININAKINLIQIRRSFKRAAQADAPFGVYTIKAVFKNVGDTPLKDMRFVVTELSNDNVLLNSTNGISGAGAGFNIPASDLGSDGVLTKDETFTVSFVIGLHKLRPFTLLVNAFGAVGSGSTSESLGWNYQMDSNLEAADQAESYIYLPLVSR